MARVLVTGGTGTLGSQLVPSLARRGHDVRALSRHGAPRRTPPTTTGPPAGAAGAAGAAGDVSYLRGDVRSGEGVGEAVAGVDVVIHAATSPRMSRAVEVEGTVNVVAAAEAVGAHVIYVSIVGVDTMKFGYYRSKYDAEKVVESTSTRWTIQRATQFHDLLDRFLGWRVFPVTAHLSFQPVDTGDVSERLADLVDAGPSGRAPDFGGPTVSSLRTLASARRRIAGSSTLLLPVPAWGILGEYDEGRHLSPDHADGTVTWEQWLEARSQSRSSS